MEALELSLLTLKIMYLYKIRERGPPDHQIIINFCEEEEEEECFVV